MVYRWSGKRWNPAGPLLEPAPDDSVHRFALATPGLYAVFRDTAAPVIFSADTVVSVKEDPRGQIHGVTLPRWEIFPVDLQDSGSGIAPRDLPYVFERFRQVGDEQSGTRRPGSGLGLAISKEIVEYHGGQIWVESQLGIGSRFVFTLYPM